MPAWNGRLDQILSEALAEGSLKVDRVHSCSSCGKEQIQDPRLAVLADEVLIHKFGFEPQDGMIMRNRKYGNPHIWGVCHACLGSAGFTEDMIPEFLAVRYVWQGIGSPHETGRKMRPCAGHVLSRVAKGMSLAEAMEEFEQEESEWPFFLKGNWGDLPLRREAYVIRLLLVLEYMIAHRTKFLRLFANDAEREFGSRTHAFLYRGQDVCDITCPKLACYSSARHIAEGFGKYLFMLKVPIEGIWSNYHHWQNSWMNEQEWNYLVPDGKWTHDELDMAFNFCGSCGKSHAEVHGIWVDHGNDMVCQSCYAKEYQQCDHCGSSHKESAMTWVLGYGKGWMCSSCYRQDAQNAHGKESEPCVSCGGEKGNDFQDLCESCALASYEDTGLPLYVKASYDYLCVHCGSVKFFTNSVISCWTIMNQTCGGCGKAYTDPIKPDKRQEEILHAIRPECSCHICLQDIAFPIPVPDFPGKYICSVCSDNHAI